MRRTMRYRRGALLSAWRTIYLRHDGPPERPGEISARAARPARRQAASLGRPPDPLCHVPVAPWNDCQRVADLRRLRAFWRPRWAVIRQSVRRSGVPEVEPRSEEHTSELQS